MWKKRTEIEGVSSKGVVELKALVQQASMDAHRRKADESPQPLKRMRMAGENKTAGQKEAFVRHNPGIEQRRARDESATVVTTSGRPVALSDEQKLALSQVMMDMKAARYARLVRGEEELPSTKGDGGGGDSECLVDFASKKREAAAAANSSSFSSQGSVTAALWGLNPTEASIYADPEESGSGSNASKRTVASRTGESRGSYGHDGEEWDDYHYERVADREAQRKVESMRLVEEDMRREKEEAAKKKKAQAKEKDKRLAKIQKLKSMNAKRTSNIKKDSRSMSDSYSP